jgi:hypothetical protein
MAAQLPDIVLLNGEEQQLYSNPLEHCWPRLDKKRPAFNQQANCRRGYIAKWEIRDNQLYLKEIDGSSERMMLLFEKATAQRDNENLMPKPGSRLIKATWFSGKLRIPKGKMTTYDEDYGLRFEQEIIITVESGDIVKMVTLDYTKRLLIVNTEMKKRSCL